MHPDYSGLEGFKELLGVSTYPVYIRKAASLIETDIHRVCPYIEQITRVSKWTQLSFFVKYCVGVTPKYFLKARVKLGVSL